MNLWRFGSVGVALLVTVLSLIGCSLWNQNSPGKGGEQAAVKGKAPAPSKEQAAAAPAPQAAKADKTAAKDKDEPAEKPLTESQKEWEERIIINPGLVSHEYFQQRQPPPGTFDLGLGKLFGRSKEDEQKQKSLEERIAKLEAERAAAAPTGSPAAGDSRAKVVVANGRGPVNRMAMVVLEPEAPNPKAFGRIPMEIVTLALEKEPRLVMVEPPMIDRILQDRQIRPTAENATQVATLLEQDLGTQLVIFLHEAAVTSDWDRRGQVHAQVILKCEIREGVTGHALSLLSAKGMQTGSGSQEALARVEALKQASDQLSTAILKKAVEYEWNARVLSVEDGRVRINAGRRSGLREGDLLRVFRNTGEEIYHPATKLFVGLDLGEPKGKARVTDFFGADAAIAKITEGSAFAPNDLVKLDTH